MKNKQAQRRVHLDFHTPDFAENVGGCLDPARFTDILAKAEVEQAAFFAKCHYGNAYYPTKTGRTHPNLKCDMLGRFTSEAVKRGIRVYAYYSLQFDVWYGKEHPDEIQHPQPFSETRCGNWTPICVSGPYAQYAREQIAEVVRDYDVAGVWLDIVGYYPYCVCIRCREGFTKSTGKIPPFSDSNPSAGIGTAFLDWQRKMLDDYTNGLARTIAEIRSGCELLCNTASGIKEKSGGGTNQSDGVWCEEAVGNTPVGLTSVSMYTGLFDTAKEPKPFEVLTQRFHMGWGDWTLRPVEALKYDVATIIARGGLPSIGDQIYGDGSFEPEVYRSIGEAFRWVKVRQDFTGETESAAEVSVYGESGVFRSDPGAIFYNGMACRHGEGLFKAMLDEHISADILCSLSSLETGRYSMLLTDDSLPVDGSLLPPLKKFIEAGGNLLSIGIPPKAYWQLLGIRESRPLPTEVSYIQMAGSHSGSLSMPVLARIQGYSVELETGAVPIAWWAHPVCKRTSETFFSHQHAPAGPVSQEPSAWRIAKGKGSVIGIAAPLSKDYWNTSYQPLRRIIASCVDMLLPSGRQVYGFNLPLSAEVTLRKNAGSLFAHITVPSPSRPGMSENGFTFHIDEPVSIHDVKLCMRIPEGMACTSANQLGTPLEIKPSERKGCTEVSLNPFTTHTVIRFDLIKK